MPTYSIKGAARQTDFSRTVDAPGPGSYHKSDRFGKDATSYTMSGKQERRNDAVSPGPGCYEAKDTLTKNTVTSFKQSSSKRQELVSRQ